MVDELPEDLRRELAPLDELPEREAFKKRLADRLRSNRPEPGMMDLSEFVELPSPSTGDFSTRLTTTLSGVSGRGRLSKGDLEAALAEADAKTPAHVDHSTPDSTLASNTTGPRTVDVRAIQPRPPSPTWVRNLLVLIFVVVAAGAVGAAVGRFL